MPTEHTKRTLAVLFTASWLGLAATAEAVYSRPMDALSVAWFAFAAAVSATAAIAGTWALVRAFQRRELRATFDGFFWLLFLVVPMSIGLSGAAIWTLGWYFGGWE